MAGASGLAPDPRRLLQPGTFDGTAKNFHAWRFQLTNYMMLVDPDYGLLLDSSEKAGSTVFAGLPTDAAQAKACTTLFVVVASSVTGRALRVLMEVKNRDGREAWRRLCAEYMPNMHSRRMALMMSIMTPQGMRDARSDDSYLDALAEWEQHVDEYEALGAAVDPAVKTAVLMQSAPSDLLQHLRIQAETIGDDYARVMQVVQGFLRARRPWAVGVRTPCGAGSSGKAQRQWRSTHSGPRKARAKDGRLEKAAVVAETVRDKTRREAPRARKAAKAGPRARTTTTARRRSALQSAIVAIRSDILPETVGQTLRRWASMSKRSTMKRNLSCYP